MVRRRARESHPVEVVDETDELGSGWLSIVSPGGYRLEGLELDEAAAVLRAFG